MTIVVALCLVGVCLGAFVTVAHHRLAGPSAALVAVGATLAVAAHSAWGDYHDAPPWQVFGAASVYTATLIGVGGLLGWAASRRLRPDLRTG